jgi:hypothetical protein
MPPRAGRRAVVLGLCFLQQGQLATTTRSTPTFNFSVADGGGFTMTIGNWTEDGRSVPPPAEATFSLQSQFSEPGVEKWTTLQPPWGGVPANFEVDRSEEEYGRTVVRVNASYDGLWILERVYQVAGHRVLVNDTLTARAGTVPSTSGGGGPSALAIYVQHILAAEAIGSVKDVVIPGSLGTYDCDNSNDDRGSFAAPQVWMATSSAAVAMMPLDDVFRVHSLATNAALAQYPRATTQRCTVSADERPTIVLADPHLGLAPGKQITLEWAIYPFGPEELDYLDFVNVLRHDLGTDEITIPHLGALGWARCTGNLTPCTVEGFESAGGFSNPHWEEWTPATAAAFFRQQGKLAITDNEDWLHGQCGEVGVDGTAFVSGAPPLFDEYLRNVTRLAKSAGGIPLVYLHTQISTGNAVCNSTVPPLGGAACEPLDDASTHSDSRVLDVNMSHVHYSHCAAGMDLPLFFPTTNNSYGEVMRQYIEKVFSLGAEGVFHDEFGQSSVSYTYGSSDGVSVIMDQNHSTVFEVAQIELLKGSLELELWGQITKHHGGWMIGNGAPTTRSWIEAMRGAARPSIHFAENSLHHRIGWVQAYSEHPCQNSLFV